MSLDKNGCWAVDLFPVFLQISGETPAINGQLHLISDGRRTLDALTWQMSLSLAPIISRGQELKDFSRSLSEHDFQVSSPSQLEDHWNSKFKTKNQILLIDFRLDASVGVSKARTVT